jgi:hypothetical protein
MLAALRSIAMLVPIASITCQVANPQIRTTLVLSGCPIQRAVAGSKSMAMRIPKQAEYATANRVDFLKILNAQWWWFAARASRYAGQSETQKRPRLSGIRENAL